MNDLNPKVVEQINAAVVAAGTMYECMQAAAELARDELNRELPAKEAIEQLVARYADVFGTNHNIKAIFKDLTTLYFAEDLPVSVDVDGEETHVFAQLATELPKHAMRDAAKEARAHFGMGRKSGGGRTAKKDATAEQVDTLRDLLARVFSSDEGVDSLKSMIKEHGYGLRKLPA
jgi:hypothetical protein